jgi:phosphoglycolate phosphatase-like HAD superfamily hydrolase
MRALVFDFDGVISDSARECFHVALQTYAELHPDSRLSPLAARLADSRELVSAILGAPELAAFLELMPLGNRAEDFGIALSAIDRGAALPDQGAYDAFYAQHGVAWRERFHTRFYERRHALIAARPADWLSLQRPFPEVVRLIAARHRNVTMAIATAKDRASLRLLLAEYGIAACFPDALVLDKETAVSKRVHLKLLAQRLGLAYSDITFIDDKVNHLDTVASLGVRCALATWGYNGPRERALAVERGYVLCTLGSLEEQFFG